MRNDKNPNPYIHKDEILKITCKTKFDNKRLAICVVHKMRALVD